MNRITLNASFSLKFWLVFQNYICKVHPHCCVWLSSFIFNVTCCKNIAKCIHFTVDGHLNCFHYVVVMKTSAVSIPELVSCYTYTRGSVWCRLTCTSCIVQIHERGCWTTRCACLNFTRKCHTVSQNSYISLYSLPAMEEFLLYHSLLILAVISF